VPGGPVEEEIEQLAQAGAPVERHRSDGAARTESAALEGHGVLCNIIGTTARWTPRS
jgi:hypothetical protein